MPWTYNCYNIEYKKADPSVLYGDKIIMPTSILEEIFNDEGIASPYMFKIERRGIASSQYCGVLEFTEEKSVFMPEWMMKNLQVSNGGQVTLTIQKNIQKGKQLKLKPSSMAFLDVAQELGVQHFLENLLRTYTILSTGEKISVYFNNEVYELTVTELKPNKVCSIVDTDIEVIFDEPQDVVRPRSKDRRRNSVEDSKLSESIKFDESKTDELSSTILSNGVVTHGTASLHKPLNKFQQKKLEQVFNSKGYKLNDDNIQVHPSISPITTSEEDRKCNENDNRLNNNTDSADSIQCKYCLAYIPKSSFDLHDLHCQRNKKMHRKICEKCHEPVLIEGFDKNHIHCDDCGKVCTIDTINEHINNEHSPVRCECGKSIPQAEYNKHILHECPKRKEICPYCQLPVEMEKWSEHIEICGSRTEKCGFCNEYIKLMDMEEHINSGCKYAVKPKPIHDEFYQREQEIDRDSDYFNMISHISRASEFESLLEDSGFTNVLINGNAHPHHELPSDFITRPDERPIHPLHSNSNVISSSLNDAFIDNSPILTEDDPEIQKAIEESLKQDYKTDLPPIDSKPVSLVTGPTPGTKRNNAVAKSKYDEFKQSPSLPQQPPPQHPMPTRNSKPPITSSSSHSNYLQQTAASKKRVSSSSKRDVTNVTYQPPPPQSSSYTTKPTTANGPKTPLKDKNMKARPRKASNSGVSGVSRVEYIDSKSSCKECGRCFDSQVELDRHVKTFHAVKSTNNKKLPLRQQQSSNPIYSTPPTRITSSKSYNKGPTPSSDSVNPPPAVRTTHSQSSSNLNSYHNEVVYDEEDPELQMALQMSCIIIFICYFII